jgi:Holliday junction resolvase RusA-like endonuclease
MPRAAVADVVRVRRLGRRVRERARARTDHAGVAAGVARRGAAVSISLTLPFPPSLNAMYRAGIKNACARCRKTAIPFTYLSDEAEAYRMSAMNLLERMGRPRILKPAEVCLTLHLYRPRAAGDLDNYFKGMLDALSGHAGYEDDSQIAELHAYRHESKERPRAELVITDLSKQGSLL